MIEDDNYEMASAYCDGELDAAQRAVVENDPHLVSVVHDIEALRTRLATAPDTVPSHPVDNDLRARHLAAAGAAFDELYIRTGHGEPRLAASDISPRSAPAPSANIIDLRNRRRYRVLSMAAGFVVIAGIGAVAIRSLAPLGSSEDSAEIATMADETSALDAPFAANQTASEATETTEAMADDAGIAASADSAEAPMEESAGETERTTPDGGPLPANFFPATATLLDISDIMGIIGEEDELPYLDGCASQLYELEIIQSSIPIQRGEATLEYIVTFEDSVFTAHLIDAECVEIEQLALETDR